MIQCIAPSCVAPHTSWYDKGVAIAAWNRRATPSPEDASPGVEGLDTIIQWYKGLPKRAREGLSLANLHTLSKALAALSSEAPLLGSEPPCDEGNPATDDPSSPPTLEGLKAEAARLKEVLVENTRNMVLRDCAIADLSTRLAPFADVMPYLDEFAEEEEKPMADDDIITLAHGFGTAPEGADLTVGHFRRAAEALANVRATQDQGETP
jgi:hypothetical protein